MQSRKFADETGPAVDDDPDTAGDQNNTVAIRMVRETAKAGSSVGNAVAASDADNDPLLYELDRGCHRYFFGPLPLLTLPTTRVPTAITNSDALFTIDDKSGQISLKGDANTRFLNVEEYATTDAVQCVMIQPSWSTRSR